MSIPSMQSRLAVPTQVSNFLAIQSVELDVTDVSGSKTFTLLPGGSGRITVKFCNTGNNTAYISGGSGSATAVPITTTPTPLSSVTNAVATCDPIPAGAILTQDFIAGTDTIAAICKTGLATTLEMTIGLGQ